jgi:hypothetical protein
VQEEPEKVKVELEKKNKNISTQLKEDKDKLAKTELIVKTLEASNTKSEKKLATVKAEKQKLKEK